MEKIYDEIKLREMVLELVLTLSRSSACQLELPCLLASWQVSMCCRHWKLQLRKAFIFFAQNEILYVVAMGCAL